MAELGVPYHTSRQMPQIRRAPLMEGVQGAVGRPHDSVVADVNAHKYREFIVYDKNQAYPEFLIEYRRA